METVIRIAIIYLVILAGLRVLGKREFGQLSPLELLSLLLIPELVSQALVREDFSLTNGLIGVCTLFGLTYLTSLVMHSSKRAEEAITGAPVVLVHRGKLIEDALNDERVSPEEVFGEMHKAGFDRLEQVRWAVLESDGRIAIVPEQQQDGGHQSAISQREAL